MTAIALTIAGSDSGGGAGVQADLKGVLGTGRPMVRSVITAVTAQNTQAVTAVHEVPSDVVGAQIAAVLDDLAVGAVKLGMLFSPAIIAEVAHHLQFYGGPVVLDPVMIAKSGDALLQDAAVEALTSELLPRASVLTPNLPEAARLLGGEAAASPAEMAEQGRALLAKGPRAVLMKGGHGAGDTCTDLLITPQYQVECDGRHATPPATRMARDVRCPRRSLPDCPPDWTSNMQCAWPTPTCKRRSGPRTIWRSVPVTGRCITSPGCGHEPAGHDTGGGGRRSVRGGRVDPARHPGCGARSERGAGRAHACSWWGRRHACAVLRGRKCRGTRVTPGEQGAADWWESQGVAVARTGSLVVAPWPGHAGTEPVCSAGPKPTAGCGGCRDRSTGTGSCRAGFPRAVL